MEDAMRSTGALSRLALALLLTGVAVHGSAGMADAGGRKFYLTPGEFPASQAPTSCDKKFHMASLWEILDPSNLEYDTRRGFNNADSGSGPPANTFGWIRTGGPATTGNPGSGAANCNAWASVAAADSGTVVELSQGWNGQANVGSPWNADTEPCDNLFRVWCVEN
jgi:hypothetical protein